MGSDNHKPCIFFVFNYKGLPNISEDAGEEDLFALFKASEVFHLPHLQDIVKNLQNEEEFLNPSIGTYLNDETGKRAKWLFLNRETLSDVRFKVEGMGILFCLSPDTDVCEHCIISTLPSSFKKYHRHIT